MFLCALSALLESAYSTRFLTWSAFFSRCFCIVLHIRQLARVFAAVRDFLLSPAAGVEQTPLA